MLFSNHVCHKSSANGFASIACNKVCYESLACTQGARQSAFDQSGHWTDHALHNCNVTQEQLQSKYKAFYRHG